jgi:hypothetical protein
MVHQESTENGGRGVAPGRVIGGSWKAGLWEARVAEIRGSERWSNLRHGQGAEAKGLAGDGALAIYGTSKQRGLGLAHKISNHELTVRPKQPVHT